MSNWRQAPTPPFVPRRNHADQTSDLDRPLKITVCTTIRQNIAPPAHNFPGIIPVCFTNPI